MAVMGRNRRAVEQNIWIYRDKEIEIVEGVWLMGLCLFVVLKEGRRAVI